MYNGISSIQATAADNAYTTYATALQAENATERERTGRATTNDEPVFKALLEAEKARVSPVAETPQSKKSNHPDLGKRIDMYV